MSVVPDTENQLDSLKRLCANLIAEEPWIIADRKQKPLPQQNRKDSASADDNDEEMDMDESSSEFEGVHYECREDINLPLPASEAVFDSLHESAGKLRIGVRSGVLGLFFSGDKMPLEHLNLELSNLTDEDLLRLLKANSDRLKSLNIAHCHLLSDKLNSKLAGFELNRLESLDLGSSLHLFADWFPSSRAKRIAKVDLVDELDSEGPGFHSDDFTDASTPTPTPESTMDINPQSSDALEPELKMEVSPEPVSMETPKFKNYITGCCPNLRMLKFNGLELDDSVILIDGRVPEFLIMVLDPVKNLEVSFQRD